jgi:hypothetical protein
MVKQSTNISILIISNKYFSKKNKNNNKNSYICAMEYGSKVVLNNRGDLMMDKRMKQLVINKAELTFLRIGDNGAEVEDADGNLFKVKLINLTPINN